MVSINRFLLITALWATKGSVLAMYVPSCNILGKKTRRLVYVMGPILLVTLVLLDCIVYQETLGGLGYPSVEQLRYVIGYSMTLD
jgi:hypothetical protein